MAEYCLNCLNKLLETNLKSYQVKNFTGQDICEA